MSLELRDSTSSTCPCVAGAGARALARTRTRRHRNARPLTRTCKRAYRAHARTNAHTHANARRHAGTIGDEPGPVQRASSGPAVNRDRGPAARPAAESPSVLVSARIVLTTRINFGLNDQSNISVQSNKVCKFLTNRTILSKSTAGAGSARWPAVRVCGPASVAPPLSPWRQTDTPGPARACAEPGALSRCKRAGGSGPPASGYVRRNAPESNQSIRVT
jgi:hypothetical protein